MNQRGFYWQVRERGSIGDLGNRAALCEIELSYNANSNTNASPPSLPHAIDDDYNNIPSTPTPGSGFSPTSPSTGPTLVERELLALATNFLLYCALGIIMYFVCSVYFPWTVQPSRPEPNSGKKLRGANVYELGASRRAGNTLIPFVNTDAQIAPV